MAQWLVVILVGIVLILGIRWGLPDERRIGLLLDGRSLTKRQRVLLVSGRDEAYQKAYAAADEIARQVRMGETAGLKEFARTRWRDEFPPVFTEQDRVNAHAQPDRRG